MRKPGFLIIFCLLFLLIFSCSVSLSEDKRVNEPENNLSQEPGKIPEWIKPPEYQYSPRSKPDPFVSFLQAQEQKRPLVQSKKKRALTPLEKVEPARLKLVGIAWYVEQPENALAMVELPDGKGFILRRGVLVGHNGGEVIKISPEQVLIQEKVINISGKLKKRNIVLKLHIDKEKKQ